MRNCIISPHNSTISHISVFPLNWFLSFFFLVWSGVRLLLPKCNAVLQLLSQGHCRPAKENSIQKSVSCFLFPEQNFVFWQGHIPVILAHQNIADIHKHSQATTSLFRTPKDSSIQPGFLNWSLICGTVMSVSHSDSVRLAFAGGVWPLQLWMHITTLQRMTWSCLQEFFRHHSIVVPGLRRFSTLSQVERTLLLMCNLYYIM